ncbi:MAG: CsgG/HfaB family protein [Candidatus Coatesbacteria bacterium]
MTAGKRTAAPAVLVACAVAVVCAAGRAAAADAAPVLKVVRTIALKGDVPRDLALSRDGATLLVGCSAEGGTGGKVKLLVAATGKALCKDIAVGGSPVAVALSPAGKYAYVTGGGDGTMLTRINLGKCESTGETSITPGAGALVFSEDGKFVYVGGESAPRIDIVDIQWNQVDGTVSGLPRGPRRAVLVPGGRFLYATVAGGKLLKIDLVSSAVAKTIPLDGTELAVSADGSQVYVSAGEWDADVKVVSTSSDTVIRTIDVELVPGALAADPLGRWLWVALPRNGKVAVVDLETGRVAATVKAGRRPARLAAAPDGRTAYCADAGDAAITVIDAAPPEPATPSPETPVVAAAPAPAAVPVLPPVQGRSEPAVTAAVQVLPPAPGRSEPAVSVAPVQIATPSATALAVAVTDFESQGVAGSVASIVTEWLRDEVLKGGAYRMLERRRMDAVLAEQSLQQTGCTDQDCAVKLGKLLNVRRMIVGSLGKFETSYVIVMRMVDVENGQVVWSGTAKGTSGDEVESAVRRLARELSVSGK